MRDIQDGVLTTKEKQKRDRVLRKEKGKEAASNVQKIANLSLSDSDISNGRKVILGKAKKIWKVGKKLGFNVRGDERDVIEEILRLEGQ